jgi:hypothetical protein
MNMIWNTMQRIGRFKAWPSILFFCTIQICVLQAQSNDAGNFQPQEPSPAVQLSDTLHPPDGLPLAANTEYLRRPFFKTFCLDFSLGAALCDFADVEPLTNSPSSSVLMFSLYLEVPANFESPVSFLGGFGFAVGGGGGGRITTLSLLMLYRHPTASFFKPLVGIGVSRTIYNFDADIIGGIAISAGETYPILIGGATLLSDAIDVFLTVPLVPALETTFESKTYTIRPAGVALSVVLTL